MKVMIDALVAERLGGGVHMSDVEVDVPAFPAAGGEAAPQRAPEAALAAALAAIPGFCGVEVRAYHPDGRLHYGYAFALFDGGVREMFIGKAVADRLAGDPPVFQETRVRPAYDRLAYATTGTRYRNYRGGLYTVTFVGADAKTFGTVVAYQSVLDGGRWVRPLDEWDDPVVWPDGVTRPRFCPVTTIRGNGS